jgi:hypothetical protein
MKVVGLTAVLILVGWAGSASADAWKDESGNTTIPVEDMAKSGPAASAGPSTRNMTDGRCKYERKLEKSGEYKEEVKCRGGYRSSYKY